MHVQCTHNKQDQLWYYVTIIIPSAMADTPVTELSQVLSSVKLGHRVRALSFVAYVQSAFYEKSQCTIGSAQAQTCSQIVPDLD